jgi:maltooligosyltrehalose synthase
VGLESLEASRPCGAGYDFVRDIDGVFVSAVHPAHFKRLYQSDSTEADLDLI